jgi:ABC-2 type transport system ATP-binding protein
VLAIEARNLTKTFQRVLAVDGIDLLVDQGEVVGLLGPNGAGKTTTLMMLLGVTEPDGGEVSLLGERLPEGRISALRKTNFTASYVSMPDRMRLREILSVYADLYGAPRSRIAEVVDLFDLGSLLRRYPSQISSGQRTLVGLAKAMLNRPRLLILDEPTASLDPEVADRVRGILLAAHGEDGLTLLVTSHNMSDIERLCRRVVFMAQGHVVADGTPAQIAARFGAENLEGTFRSIANEARR